MQSFLLFSVAGTACALPRAQVRELLPLPTLYRPPGAPRPLAGFLNLAGRAVPVLALAEVFGQSEGADPLYSHLILVDGALPGRLAALQVARVQDLVRVEDSAVRLVDPDTAENACVTAEAQIGTELVHVLAVPRILMVAEQQRIAGLAARAEERLADWASV